MHRIGWEEIVRGEGSLLESGTSSPVPDPITDPTRLRQKQSSHQSKRVEYRFLASESLFAAAACADKLLRMTSVPTFLATLHRELSRSS